MTDFFKNNKSAKNVLKFVYKIFPLIVFASYPILLVYTFLWQRDLFLKSLTVPAGVFLGITLLRIIIKEERPYVRYGVAPVFAKNSKPDSMPSRHTASAFIIAMTILRFNVWAGIAYLFIAVMISVSRVCAGVHYVRDVIVGAAIAILCGIVFLFLLF
nr:phosphatase PAP2 family protein [Ruminococcus bromii]